MHFSYWENKTWFTDIDFAVIGSGIVGLTCAINLRRKHPNSKIVVFERGILPSGASTKNAGFTCYGSISEILDDLKSHSADEVAKLVSDRVAGLQLLRVLLGDKGVDYKEYGGYELFPQEDIMIFEKCSSMIEEVNRLLFPIFRQPVFSEMQNHFGFENIVPKLIFSKFEGQIDTGKMMWGLIKKAITEDIFILNSSEITELSD